MIWQEACLSAKWILSAEHACLTVHSDPAHGVIAMINSCEPSRTLSDAYNKHSTLVVIIMWKYHLLRQSILLLESLDYFVPILWDEIHHLLTSRYSRHALWLHRWSLSSLLQHHQWHRSCRKLVTERSSILHLSLYLWPLPLDFAFPLVKR